MKNTEINRNNLNNNPEKKQLEKYTEISEIANKPISKENINNKKVFSEHHRSFRGRWGSSNIL